MTSSGNYGRCQMMTKRTADDRTRNRTSFDLLVIPSRSLVIAGGHLSPAEVDRARSDWAAYGNSAPVDPSLRWTIAVCNPKGGEGRVHSVMQIPAYAGA